MKTEFYLAAQYDGMAVIPLAVVCRDYFSHLSVDRFVRKVSSGEIKIPVIRMDSSQKAAKGIHIADLGSYLDGRREAAIKEAEQIASALASTTLAG